MEEKKIAQEKLEENKNKRKADEDTERKRLINRLKRELSEKVKDLMANLELVQENNKEIEQKLQTEIEGYDKLLKEKMYAEYDLELKTAELKEDTEIVKEQEDLIKQLDEAIAKEQAEVEALTTKVDKARIVNRKEDDDFREIILKQTSLRAKKDFIETEYEGYTTNVDEMGVQVFKNIIDTNLEVNKTVEQFSSELEVTKTEVKTYMQELRNKRKRERD